jgi:outer membrane protein assembly factor BamD
MEKADRDFTHAKRAEDEYRKMILQYPDSKLVPEAKRRLLEVQEVLGEREFEIGRFYYLRGSNPASIARLQSLVDKYPLYSHADEALYLLGQNYEAQIARVRAIPTCDAHGMPARCIKEKDKADYVGGRVKDASDEYSKIITRYPLMDRSDDARKRLAALHQPIPRPTKGEVARNRAEMESRGASSTVQKLMGVVKKGPDVANASKVGEPSLVETEPIAATNIIRNESGASGTGENRVGVDIVNPNQPAPDANAPTPDAASPGGSPFGNAASGAAPAAATDANELKPNASVDPNELKPTDTGSDQALPPPPQVNEIPSSQSSSYKVSADDSTPATDAELSSSKKKHKKGLKKVVPF